MSKENVVADSWEDADADPVKGLMDKMDKVKILNRKEEKKEAFFEKVKNEEGGANLPKLQVDDGNGPSVEEPKRVFLRRPKDGFSAETVADSSPPSSASSQSVSRGRNSHKNNQKQQPTLEERQAAYQAARDRIMGSEYKPDNQEIKEIKFIDRSKSPETLRMTEQNLVEHYGEELSKELMQQPSPPAAVPDFTLQQPPPCLVQPEVVGGDVYNGPPGFQTPRQQQHYVENVYYPPYNAQAAFQQSSSSQNASPDEVQQQQQPVYYTIPFQNYMPYNLPNMAFPPPNFQPQNPQQQSQNHMVPMYQHHQSMPRGQNVPPRVQPLMYPLIQMPPQMYQNQNHQQWTGRQMAQQQQQQNQNQNGNGGSGGRKMKPKTPEVPQQHVPMPPGQNPIPFGCPPLHVNAIREQYASMTSGPPNPGAGLLGAHPMMTNQWTGPPRQH